jgi:hypothetical protein
MAEKLQAEIDQTKRVMEDLANGTSGQITEPISVVVNGRHCEISSIVFSLKDIEVLIGMDWLSQQNAHIGPLDIIYHD